MILPILYAVFLPSPLLFSLLIVSFHLSPLFSLPFSISFLLSLPNHVFITIFLSYVSPSLPSHLNLFPSLSLLSLHLSCLTSSTYLSIICPSQLSYTHVLFHPSLLLSLSPSLASCLHVCSTCPIDHQCEGCLCSRTEHSRSRVHRCDRLQRSNSG